MPQNFEAGRRIERDAIIGAALELANWRDVPVPTEGLSRPTRLGADTPK
jgi:ketopantoate reductase